MIIFKVVIALCGAIESLCLCELGDSNRAKFASQGAITLLMRVLQIHMDEGCLTRVPFAAAVCAAIGSLLREGNTQVSNQAIFNEQRAPDALAHVLQRYISSASVSTSCCNAICLIACGNLHSQTSLLECGAVEALSATLRQFVGDEAVVIQASLAIAELSLNNVATSTELGKLGVCRDIVAALTKHRGSEAVCEACCRSIFSLKELNILLGAAGACEAVLPVLTQHPASENVAQWVCRAIGSLAENPSNKKILGASYACETVTQALQRHVANESILSVVLMRNTSSAGVAQWGCSAM